MVLKLGFPVFPMDWTENGETLKGCGERYFLKYYFLTAPDWNPEYYLEIFSISELIALFDLEKSSYKTDAFLTLKK